MSVRRQVRVAKYLNGLDGCLSECVDERVSMGGDRIVVMVSDEYVPVVQSEIRLSLAVVVDGVKLPASS